MDAIEKYNKKFDAHIKKVKDTIKCEKCGRTDLISFPNDERNPYLIEFYCMNHNPSSGINEYKWIRRLNHEEIEVPHFQLVKMCEKLKEKKLIYSLNFTRN